MSLADEYKRTVDPVHTRRERIRFGLGTRWYIVRARLAHARSWRVRWHDLWYLVRG